MPVFVYTARDQRGQIVRGTVEAISIQAARAGLRSEALEVEELHETRPEDHFLPQTEQQPDTSGILEEQPPEEPKDPEPAKPKTYYPLSDTLRLYAGWLLAWYVLVYAIGGYQYTRTFAWGIPYVEALLPPFSSIVFQVTFGTFLFLLLSSIHRAMGGGKLRGLGLCLLGLTAFALYSLNI